MKTIYSSKKNEEKLCLLNVLMWVFKPQLFWYISFSVYMCYFHTIFIYLFYVTVNLFVFSSCARSSSRTACNFLSFFPLISICFVLFTQNIQLLCACVLFLYIQITYFSFSIIDILNVVLNFLSFCLL